jgi:deferrochelatase/peroxidase EfeB
MTAAASSSAPSVNLEMDDIQSGALHHRPAPYVGRFLFLRVDDRHAGRALLRRLLPAVEGRLPSGDPNKNAWAAVALTYQGLRALGVPQESLDSFPLPFRQGMAARADVLRDVGEE